MGRSTLPPTTKPCPDDKRGTRAGALWHRGVARERPCTACRVADKAYAREYRSGARKRNMENRWHPRQKVFIGVETLAEVYLSCPPELQVKLEEQFGTFYLDRWVEQFDRKQNAEAS